MKYFVLLALASSALFGGTPIEDAAGRTENHRLAVPLSIQQSQDNFKALIDGKPFAADENYASDGGGMITINAMNNKAHSFTIQLPADIKEGEYELNYDNADRYMFTYFNNEDGGEAMSGKLKVTAHDKGKSIIQASFEFQGEMSDGSTFAVSNGSFKFHYKVF